MNWDKFDIHLENLIPGLSLATILLIFRPEIIDGINDNKVLIATGFVAISYLAGSVANIIARVLLAPISPLTLRVPFIRAFAKSKISDIQKETKKSLNKLYSQYIDYSMICGNDNVIKEVLKRRQTARLCRSALLPILFIVIMYITLEFKTHNIKMYLWLSANIVTTYFVLLVLYSYSEVVVFTEASRGARIFELQKSKINDQ